jgi:hypothetical protein
VWLNKAVDGFLVNRLQFALLMVRFVSERVYYSVWCALVLAMLLAVALRANDGTLTFNRRHFDSCKAVSRRLRMSTLLFPRCIFVCAIELVL